MRSVYPWTSCCHVWFLVLIILYNEVMKTASFCGEPDPIADATSNSTGSGSYEENTVIRYDCNSGYRISGSMFYTCEEGEWLYGSLTCIKIFCMELEVPEHGQMVGSREIGTRAYFECNTGYDLIGYTSLLCRADGEWRPSQPPKCEPKSCGEFGRVENAKIWQSSIDGRKNIYGSVIEVTCKSGFILVGKARVTCSANGQWDDKPSCRPTVCPQHPGLSSSCIYDIQLDEVILTILCKENSDNISVTAVEPLTAICMDDKWDDLNIACYCDCKIDTTDASLTVTNLVNGFLKHGHDLQWRCTANTFKSTEETVHCHDGILSQIPGCKADVTTNPLNSNDASTEVMVSSAQTQPPNISTVMETEDNFKLTTNGLVFLLKLTTSDRELTSKATANDHESTPKLTTDDQNSPSKLTTGNQDFSPKASAYDQESTPESTTADEQDSLTKSTIGYQEFTSKSTKGDQDFTSKTTPDDQGLPRKSTPKSNVQLSGGVNIQTAFILHILLNVICIVLPLLVVH